MEQIKQYVGAFRFYAVCLMLLCAAVYIGYRLGNVHNSQQQKQIQGLQNSVSELNRENHLLTRQLNILGVELEVSRLANQASQDMMQQTEKHKASLKKELSMYQKVMAPELNQDGFGINSVKVENTSVDNMYRLSLILVQQNKSKGYVKGSAHLLVKGSLNGKMKEISLVPLMDEKQERFNFSFRYFELLDGEFRLPEGFTPEQLVVTSHIRTSKKRSADLVRVFPWQEINANS